MIFKNSNNIIKNTQQGFTLLEMLLAVSVLAIMLTMMFPDLVSFLKKADEKTEQAQMAEIRTAFELYAKNEKTLPTTLADIEEYSNLSTVQISNDVYGKPRSYEVITVNKTFRDTTLAISYAAVSSNGGDGVNDTTSAASMTTVDHYEALLPGNDDHLIKFTDFKIQIENYEITQQRIKNIKKALEAYALRLFNVASDANGAVVAAYVAANGDFPSETEARSYAASNNMDYYPDVDKRIYYPVSGNTGDSGIGGKYSWTKIHNGAWVYAEMAEDLRTFIDIPTDTPGTEIRDVYNQGPSASANEMRLFRMKGFMRLLGLPEENCCDAMVNAGDLDSDGQNDEMPLYYCSNPKVGGVYPGLNDRKVPAVIQINPSPCD